MPKRIEPDEVQMHLMGLCTDLALALQSVRDRWLYTGSSSKAIDAYLTAARRRMSLLAKGECPDSAPMPATPPGFEAVKVVDDNAITCYTEIWWVEDTLCPGVAGCVMGCKTAASAKQAYAATVPARADQGAGDAPGVDVVGLVAKPLPYAALPVVAGPADRAPAFCYDPNGCKGNTSCPKRRACSE
jgi:hypothetical protein